MAPDLVAIESQSTVVELTDGEAAMLAALGRELASTRSWWGATTGAGARSVVELVSVGASRYRVTFRDVVGAIRIGDRQLNVQPKIPLAHFAFLAGRSSLAPRLSQSPVHVSDSSGLVELLVSWMIGAAEVLLRHGLRKDYAPALDELDAGRGHILVCETAMRLLSAQATVVCEFEELTDDAPLNRVIKAACERVARMPAVSKESRMRARRVAFRMDGVGPLRDSDLRTRVDRVSQSYSRVVPLAALVLAGCGLSTSIGSVAGSSFLFRTPEIVEDGLRATLTSALPGAAVSKKRLMLGDSGLSVNPDLVFGEGLGVGDVKYRQLASDWDRGDLNQVVTFATAFGCSKAAVLGFTREPNRPLPRVVPVGSVVASAFAWVASEQESPEQSAVRLATQIERWLSNTR